MRKKGEKKILLIQQIVLFHYFYNLIKVWKINTTFTCYFVSTYVHNRTILVGDLALLVFEILGPGMNTIHHIYWQEKFLVSIL